MSRKCDIGVVRLMSLGILTSFPGGAIGRAGRKAGDLITIRMDPADIPIGTPPPPTPPKRRMAIRITKRPQKVSVAL